MISRIGRSSSAFFRTVKFQYLDNSVWCGGENATYEVFPCSSFYTNCYLMYDDTTTIIIDTPSESFRKLENHEALQNEDISILITHGHYDHVGDLHNFQNNFDLDTYYLKDEEVKVLEGVRMFTDDIPAVTEYLRPGTVLRSGLGDVEILHIPGHTPGSAGYYFKDGGFVFVGDVLFQGSIGRTDLGDGDFNVLCYSIKEKLYKLDEDTIVLPGHGPSTQIMVEKMTNPFVREGM